MDVPHTWRIVLLGKTGSGKSSLANTIFGEEVFSCNHTLKSETKQCQAQTKAINGKKVTLIDSPGFFDPGRSDEDMKPEMLRCITECAPGPHAFLIVLKVERFTEQEKAVITKICEHFSEDALTHATVVFTHGDQLPDDMKIEEYVSKSDGLSDLLKKCGGRCHIVDNKYWKNSQQDEYRNNKVQIAELLSTIEKIVMDNNGGYYTNEKLQAVESEIQREEERIRRSAGNMLQDDVRQAAKSSVFKKQVEKTSWTLMKGFVGLAVVTGLLATVTAMLRLLPEAPVVNKEFIEPTVDVVAQEIAEVSVTPSAGQVIKKTFEAIMDRLYALYERTYHPWNPLE